MALTARYGMEYEFCSDPALNKFDSQPRLSISTLFILNAPPPPSNNQTTPFPAKECPRTIKLSKNSFVPPQPGPLPTQGIYATPPP